MCCTGGTVGSRQMEYSPGLLPTTSKELGNAFLSVNMSLMSANANSLVKGLHFINYGVGKGLHL